jgi:putative transposase
VVRAYLREPAAARPTFGQKRLHVLLRRDGLAINHRKTERLYREEGLALKPKQRKRRRAMQAREGCAALQEGGCGRSADRGG